METRVFPLFKLRVAGVAAAVFAGSSVVDLYRKGDMTGTPSRRTRFEALRYHT